MDKKGQDITHREDMVDVLNFTFMRLQSFSEVLADYADRCWDRRETESPKVHEILSNLEIVCRSLVDTGRAELDAILETINNDLGRITLARSDDGRTWTDARVEARPEK